MAALHLQLHHEHVSLAGFSGEDGFKEETRNARSRYSSFGRLKLPWLRWGPDKTTAELYKASQERRKDPEYMKYLDAAQAELDKRAHDIKGVITQTADMIKDAGEQRRTRSETYRKSRHGRLLRTR